MARCQRHFIQFAYVPRETIMRRESGSFFSWFSTVVTGQYDDHPALARRATVYHTLPEVAVFIGPFVPDGDIVFV